MKFGISDTQRAVVLAFSLFAMGPLLLPSMAQAQAQFVVMPVVEKKIEQLPAGTLYWQLENFPTLAEAQAAAGPTAMAAEVEGKVWLFTLGPQGSSTHGGNKVVEIGPVTPITAPEYLLRINHAVAPSGTKTAVHTHAGSEAFYVLAGQLSQKTPQGVSQVEVGQTMPGRGPDTPMEVSSSGATELHALVMFIVDATKPFSTPAHME
jgi:hypothetical protein